MACNGGSYRLSTLVTTLVSESLLVHPGEVPVPREEVSSVMYSLGLVQVNSHPVVEPRLGTVGEGLRCLGRQSLQTLDSANIILPLLLGESSPKT